VRVYLVRHAKAEPGEPDDLRRLAKKGRKQSAELGERFAHEGIDAVVSSPLVRARETAEAIAKTTGKQVETDDRLRPGATATDLRAAVEGRGERVVVVGHQPDCSRIAAEITGGPEPEFPTAGVCELDLD
jgi:phosphohistidine phosphatase